MKKYIVAISILLIGSAAYADKVLKPSPSKVTYYEKLLVQELFENIQMMSSIEGDFFQTDNYTKKNKGALGRFYFEYPRKILFDYDPPNHIAIVANRGQVLIRDTKRKSKKYYPASQTPMKFLSEKPEKLAFGDKVKDVYEKDNIVYVRITQQSLFGKADVTLEFNKNKRELIGWTSHEKRNNVHVELYNLSYGKDLDDGLFYIEPNEIK